MLIILSITGIGACGLLVSTARADLDKFKVIAYQAKNASEDNAKDVQELKKGVQEIRTSQETQRKEYREDRQKDAEMLRQMEDRIIRAVKA